MIDMINVLTIAQQNRMFENKLKEYDRPVFHGGKMGLLLLNEQIRRTRIKNGYQYLT